MLSGKTSTLTPQHPASRAVSEGPVWDAIKVFGEGIDVNPLVASLHYNLWLALEQEKKTVEAEAEMALAAKIDPNVRRR